MDFLAKRDRNYKSASCLKGFYQVRAIIFNRIAYDNYKGTGCGSENIKTSYLSFTLIFNLKPLL